MEGARFQALGETPTILSGLWPSRGSCALLRGILTRRDGSGISVGSGQPHHLRLGGSTRRHRHSPHQALREVAARLVNEASDFREHRPETVKSPDGWRTGALAGEQNGGEGSPLGALH